MSVVDTVTSLTCPSPASSASASSISSHRSSPRRRWTASQVHACTILNKVMNYSPLKCTNLTVLTLTDDLERRRRVRQKKARDEKRREKRIEMEENRKQGKCEMTCDVVLSLVHRVID